MMAPIKFLYWVLSVVFAFGLTDAFARLTYDMATAAVHAHERDQLSYGKFSRLLWSKDVTVSASKRKLAKMSKPAKSAEAR